MLAESSCLRIRDIHPIMDGSGCSLLYDLERTFVIPVPENLREAIGAVFLGREEYNQARAWLLQEELLTAEPARKRADPPTLRLPPVTDVSLDLAGSCNMACSYCFENAIHSRIGKMPDETVDAALDFAFKHAAGSGKLALHFGSGEPLLRFDRLARLVETANLRAGREGIRVNYELTTNATLVTEEIAEFLAANPFNVRVSCDGPPEVHDVFRPMAGGQPSYNRVAQGLGILLRHLPERVTVNTVVCGRTRLRQVWEWARSINVRHFHVIKVGAYDERNINLRRSELNSFRRDLDDIAEAIFRDLEEGRSPMDYQPLTKVIRRLMIPEPITRFCGVASSYLGVAADGMVYPCFRHLGLAEYHVGSVSDSSLRDDRRLAFLKHEAADVDSRPVCKGCWARYLCGGGCYADSVVYGPDRASPQAGHCPFWVLEIETAIRLYERLRSEDPTYCLRLFAAEEADDYAFINKANCS